MKTKQAEAPHATFTTLDGPSGLPVAVKVWPDEVDRIESSGLALVAGTMLTFNARIRFRNMAHVRVTQSRAEVIDALHKADEEAKRLRVAEGHNPDRVKYGQLDPLNEGWRLLTLDEIERNRSRGEPVHGVELWAVGGRPGWVGPANGTSRDVTYRTKHPAGYFLPDPKVAKVATAPTAPGKIARGHNPDRLTEEQVGVADGWRLLAPEEIVHRAEATPDIQARVGEGTPVRWVGTYRGDHANLTYRTKKPAGYYLPTESATRSPEPSAKPAAPQEAEIKLPGGAVYAALFHRRGVLFRALADHHRDGHTLTAAAMWKEVKELDIALDEIKERGYRCSITLTREP